MNHTLLYSEMNQAVPGSSLSPGQEMGGYGECQVPSPSQWSDPCYSPPSFHSPQHLPGDLDKVKEEMFPPSPVSSCGTFPPSPPSSLHLTSPYARLQPAKKESFEASLNLTELLSENQVLTRVHQPAQYASYPDHPLLRGCLEDINAFQKIELPYKTPTPPAPTPAPAAPTPAPSSVISDGLGFLDMLVDVKQEVEEDLSAGSSCGSPASPPLPDAAAACQRDILETVEQLALEHARRDVQRISDSLNIPRDPAHWSVADVRAWLNLQAAQLHLPPLMLNFWNLGGPALLKLTETQFRQLAPVGGELLYAQLEIWRGALRAVPKLQYPQYWHLQQPEPFFLQCPQPHHHHQQQQVPQVDTLIQIGSPGQMASPSHMGSPSHVSSPSHVGSPSHVSSSGVGSPSSVGSPASPPVVLSATMSQVPTSVVQVTQQQQQHLQAAAAPSCRPQASGPPPQPAQQQQATSGTVFLEEQCHDMVALLQQQASPEVAHPARLPAHSPHEDAFDSDEEVEEEVCTTPTTGRGGTHIHLWQFLKELLQQPQLYGSCIRWLDRPKGVFKIEDSVRVARLWGKRKNRPAMNYDKLSRSIRQYYKKGIMKKTERSQRLVYQFCHPYCL